VEDLERIPEPSLVTVTHLIYALHSAAIVTGLVGAATIVGSFVGGLPSLAAVILNYVKRSATRGTVLESHFRWQIRTFWYALLWVVVGWMLFLTLVGIPLALVVWASLTCWVIYRVGRGWLALNDHQPMPD
jgi:uncharacterized membrane protein